jgi:Ca2+:H+ antiporter
MTSPAAAPPAPRFTFGLPVWTILAPLLGMGAIALGKPHDPLTTLLVAGLLGAAIMAAVYHAEIIAHYVGEPFGTLILALAVTVIEVSLIVSIMLAGGEDAELLARDTLIATIMITINGIIGICLLVGGRRHLEQAYTQAGVSAGLAMLATLSVLTLVLPDFTETTPGPYYSASQLLFVATVSVIVYATFVLAQTIRHRDYFIHQIAEADDHAHKDPVPGAKAAAAAVMLLGALVAVVLLAKNLSPVIEARVVAAGLPKAVVGIIIAAVVLAPEGFSALRAAMANRVQTSLNLAIGSALASIGLTIPAVALVSLGLGLDLELGLAPGGLVLLGLTLLVATLTLGQGRTTIVQGVIHLVIFATYLFTTIVP